MKESYNAIITIIHLRKLINTRKQPTEKVKLLLAALGKSQYLCKLYTHIKYDKTLKI